MVTFGATSASGLAPALVVQLIAALFILPFLLFSATSGQLADKFDKARLIRFVKNLEIAIMAIALYGFTAKACRCCCCTFLLGVHSTLFGPVKYAYLPQQLDERELTGGNGMVEMGTFVAILLGNVVGGLLIAVPGRRGYWWPGLSRAGAARPRERAGSCQPSPPATDAALQINWNPVTETWRNLKLAHGSIVVFRSLLGISWMWFFGAVF